MYLSRKRMEGTSRPTRRRFSSSSSSSSPSTSSSSDDDGSNSDANRRRMPFGTTPRFQGLAATANATPGNSDATTETLMLTELLQLSSHERAARNAMTTLEERLHQRHARLFILMQQEVTHEKPTTEATSSRAEHANINESPMPSATTRALFSSPRESLHTTGALRHLTPTASSKDAPPDSLPQLANTGVKDVHSSPSTTIARCGVSSDEDNEEEGPAEQTLAVMQEPQREAPMHARGLHPRDDGQPQEQLPDGVSAMDVKAPTGEGNRPPLAQQQSWCEMQTSPSALQRRARPLSLPQDASDLRPTPPRMPPSHHASGACSYVQQSTVTPDGKSVGRRDGRNMLLRATTHRAIVRASGGQQRTPVSMLTPLPSSIRQLSHQEAHDLYFATICVPESFEQRLQRTALEAKRVADSEMEYIRMTASEWEARRVHDASEKSRLEAAEESMRKELHACAEERSWWALQLFHVTAVSLLLHGHTSASLRYDRVRLDGDELLWDEVDAAGSIDVVSQESWIRLLMCREECLMWLLCMQAAGASRARACSSFQRGLHTHAHPLSLVASPRSIPDSSARGDEYATPLSEAATRPTSQMWSTMPPSNQQHRATLGSVLPLAPTSSFTRDRMTSGRARFQFTFIPTPSSNSLPQDFTLEQRREFTKCMQQEKR
ncbi:Hypothetical protein, putative [Bodo saltans]|uniref:Uncharacterized protein n=1 Tax=Bodo saltans TaxID=75058 RepID=A0A0S4JG47_BODSA|nr:Hypothetical protein, putative [Bodo saltans]|eukprot:CUG89146.1 Hypothetical protein, putative [Bodo saltans]